MAITEGVIERLRFSLSSLKMKKKSKPIVATHHCASSKPKSKEFECVFRFFDENGDGKISAAELKDCMRVSGSEELSLEAAEAVVESADSDGDGLLGFDDFVTLIDAQGEERVRSLKEAFEVYYEVKAGNGEGCITAKSLRRALQRLGEARSVEECREMIRRYDENGDGVISFEEFRNMMMV